MCSDKIVILINIHLVHNLHKNPVKYVHETSAKTHAEKVQIERNKPVETFQPTKEENNLFKQNFILGIFRLDQQKMCYIYFLFAELLESLC